MKSVVTIGLGYIGLPTSALIASKGTPVYGVDINKDVVDTINKGEIHIVEPDLQQIVKESVENGTLKAGTKAIESDVYLIVVPTPFKENHEPDISYIEAATQGIITLLKEDDLYIIESTSPIGTTEKMRDLIISKRPELRGKLNIAYCPERVLPGNVMHELVYNDRVIGGIDEKSTKKAVEFYSKFVKGELHSTNAKTAEMCKLVENSSRDVQIAFANELSIICDKAGIDVWELIDLANKHPRVNILRPGSGVGGHCIAVDPYFITSKFPIESKLIGTAREINNYKALWCVEKIEKAKLEFEFKNGRKPKTALMGLAFKPNIDDLRESPAAHIVKKIVEVSSSLNYHIVEPNIANHPVYELSDYKYAAMNADIIVFLVAHDEFWQLKLDTKKIILDFCGITK
jgi:UDP-N-acetyl-D-mannosaminuronic acid dehydrogenase